MRHLEFLCHKLLYLCPNAAVQNKGVSRSVSKSSAARDVGRATSLCDKRLPVGLKNIRRDGLVLGSQHLVDINELVLLGDGSGVQVEDASLGVAED